MRVCPIWLCCLVFLASAPARAEDRVIADAAAGECILRVEAAENWPALRLRALHPRGEPCAAGQETVVRLLEQAFARLDSVAPGREFTSISFGRLIDYPWMVRFLAESAASDRNWDAVSGKPKAVHENRYVADVLARREIAGPLEAPLRRHGYRIAGASVEKVLIGGVDNVPGWDGPLRSARIPFDAQTWFRLRAEP